MYVQSISENPFFSPKIGKETMRQHRKHKYDNDLNNSKLKRNWKNINVLDIKHCMTY